MVANQKLRTPALIFTLLPRVLHKQTCCSRLSARPQLGSYFVYMSDRRGGYRDRGAPRDERDRDRDRGRDRDYERRDWRARDRDDHGRGDRRRSRSRSPRRAGRSERDKDGRDRRDDPRRDNRPRDRDDRKDYGRDDRGKHGDDRAAPRKDEARGSREDREKDKDSRQRKPGVDDSAARPHNSPPPEPDAPPPADPKTEGEIEEGEDMEEDEMQMMTAMGFGGFDSTKGKPVNGNQQGAANVKKQRTWRQYMNRKGGFNRPLDKVK
ncbi:hypothetical protein ACGC1H_004452 [Rhizoctonia solani]